MEFGQGDDDLTLCCESALFGFVDNTVPSHNDISTPVSWYRPVLNALLLLGTSMLATLYLCYNQAAGKGYLACKTVYTVCLCAI